MTDLDELIQFWKAALEIAGSSWTPSQERRIQDTITALEELKKLKGE